MVKKPVCGVHALDSVIHDDCPECTRLRIAWRDTEIERLRYELERVTEEARDAMLYKRQLIHAKVEVTRLQEKLTTVKTDYQQYVDGMRTAEQAEIERLRKLLAECRRRLVNPCRFPCFGVPCGNCEACHDIQMTLEALRRMQDD